MGKQDRRRKLTGLVVLVFTIILLTALSLGKRGFVQQLRIRNENRQLRKISETLKADKKRLETEKKNLEDPDYIEKVAREEYNMAKKNEKVLHVVPKEKK